MQRKRHNGEGSLYLLRGFWYARFSHNGKIICKSTRTRDKADAVRALNRMAYDLATPANPIPRPVMMIAEVFREFETSPARRECGEKMLSDYRRWWRIFSEFLDARGVTSAADISPAAVADFFRGLDKRLSNTTYNKILDGLKKIWKTLRRVSGGDPYLFDDVARRRQLVRSRRVLSLDELRAVISAASGEMRALLEVGIYTGLRLSDCALLKSRDVNFADGVICLQPKKTESTSRQSVIIPIHPDLAPVLQAARPAHGFLFPTMAETYRHDPTKICKAIRKLFESVGIATRQPGFGARNVTLAGFHSLRHSFVSLCAASGAPLAVVQALVGHSTEAMTQHYLHVDTAAARAAVDRLPDVTSGDSAPAATRETDTTAAKLQS